MGQLLDKLVELRNSGEIDSYKRLSFLRDELNKPENVITAADVELMKNRVVIKDVFFEKESRKKTIERLQTVQIPECTLKFQNLSTMLKNEEILFTFYKEVLTLLTKKYLDYLSGLLTEVYTVIYQDRSKRVQLSMEDYGKKKVMRLNVVNSFDTGSSYLESFDEECGSAKIILGLILSIYYIILSNSERIMFLDESLGQLDTEIGKRLLSVLKVFCEKYGFTFVIICHHPIAYKDYFDSVYEVKDGIYRKVYGLDSFFAELEVSK